MAVRKKDGGPNLKHYESPDVVALFDSVRNWLTKNAKKHVQADPPTNKALATLACQLMQFQEDSLGKGATSPPMTRIPAKLFADYAPGGALCQALAIAYRTKAEQSWRRFDFQSPSRVDKNVEMMAVVEQTLVEQNFLTFPVIYIRDDVDKLESARLTDIAQSHKATITSDPKQATHIIHPAPPPLPDEEWLRPLLKKDKQVLVHWWYYPDSYDSWVSASEVDEDPEPPPEFNKQWEVNARWLLDLEIYNEWMNEEDYEVTERDSSSPGQGRRRSIQKGKLHLADDVRCSLDESGKRKGKRKRSPSPQDPAKKRKGRGRLAKKRRDDSE
ncbi:SWI/SNF complex subunit SMARCC2-like [Oscarella lobularis]|uniref:SWI/SNF complex subunit SMARCC2-like n=1 Tax=Oscarella lobularis TaxID=121494 RepID=UPI003313BA55